MPRSDSTNMIRCRIELQTDSSKLRSLPMRQSQQKSRIPLPAWVEYVMTKIISFADRQPDPSPCIDFSYTTILSVPVSVLQLYGAHSSHAGSACQMDSGNSPHITLAFCSNTTLQSLEAGPLPRFKAYKSSIANWQIRSQISSFLRVYSANSREMPRCWN